MFCSRNPWLRWSFLLVATVVLSAGMARADSPEILYLKGGDRITGFNRGLVEGAVSWELPHGGMLSVPLESIDRIEYPRRDLFPEALVETAMGGPVELEGIELAEEASAAVTSGLGPELEPEPAGAPQPWWATPVDAACGAYTGYYQQAVEYAADWTQRIELGGLFRDGNSEEEDLNVGAQFERDDGDRVIAFDLGGQYGQANGDPVSNRWFGNTTLDVNKNGNWIVFITSRNEFDEFENLDWRGTLAGGFGYRFFNDDPRRLIVRVGPGVTHEKFHAPRLRRTTPDLLGEFEVRWPVFSRTEFEQKTTINPSVEDLSVFRLTSRYGIIVRLDEGEHWSLRVGLRHEFNSDPNEGRQPSDYTTTIQLVYEVD